MKKLLLAAMCVASVAVYAQKTPVWKDPAVNQVNREARRAAFFAFEDADKARVNDKTKSSRYLSMEGKWRFNFVKDHNLAPKDFFAVKFDEQGELVAFAASDFRSVKIQDCEITLSDSDIGSAPIDVALWRDSSGKWRGVFQRSVNDAPESLWRFTERWNYLKATPR